MRTRWTGDPGPSMQRRVGYVRPSGRWWVLSGLLCVAQPLTAQTTMASDDGLIVHRSDADFATTLARVEPAVKATGLFVMRVMDHSAAAAQFGRALAPNTVVLFGNPQIGSQLMACEARVGIDLPQKLLLWEAEGAVLVAYNDPAYLARRHAIEGCDQVLASVADNLRAVAGQVSGGGSVASPVGARERTAPDLPVFRTLQGEWEGTGVLLGGRARFTMRWETVDTGFVQLAFTNARMGSDGAWAPVLSARATYHVGASTAVGVWVDDRPQRLTVDGVIDDSSFVAKWTAEGERGRTEYVVRSQDEVVVRDVVFSDGAERTFAEATYHRARPRVGPVTEELRGLYEADQADRRPATPPTPEMWAEITARDVARRDRVVHLLRSDSLQAAEDFYHAAMVLQHGQGSEDILIAHILATAAAYLGDERGQWLSAAALDRYLHRSRAPQRLGTQYVKADDEDPFVIDGTRPWSQGPYEDWLPDSIREIFGVEGRAQQAERVRALNRGGGTP